MMIVCEKKKFVVIVSSVSDSQML